MDFIEEFSYLSSMHQHSLFSFGISYKLVSHSVIGLVTSEPGYSSEEPAPWLTLFPFHAAWLREALVSAGVTILPSEDRPPVQLLHRPLFHHRWPQSRVSHQVSPEHSRAQRTCSLLLGDDFVLLFGGKKEVNLIQSPVFSL